MKSANNKNPAMRKGFRFMGLSLPFLVLGPVVITMGFKAIAHSQSYFLLILGFVLAITAVLFMVAGIRQILNALFDDKK